MEYRRPMLPRISSHLCLVLPLVVFFAAACSDDSSSAADARASSDDSGLVFDANDTPDATIVGDNFGVVSTAYDEGGVIPIKYSCNGANVSPPLTWSDAPDNTQSFAVVFLDTSTDFLHSVIWDIPSSRSDLPEDIEKVGSSE